MKASEILLNFANRTSLHGVPKVIEARSAVSRCIWAVICVTASLIFAVQISEVLRRFFSFPKKVSYTHKAADSARFFVTPPPYAMNG